MMFDMDDENVEESRSKQKQVKSSGNSSYHGNEKRKGGNSSSTASSYSSSIRSHQHHPLIWMSGSCSIIGIRSSNEDRFVSFPVMVGSRISDLDTIDIHGYFGGGLADSCGFFAVFDGHGGDAAAKYMMEELHTRVVQ
jgi:hypothetical protein